MEIWTILSKNQYEKYSRDKVLYAEKDIVEAFWINDFEEPNFISSYRWLSSIMKKKNILDHHYPMWAWTENPDMRKERFKFKNKEEIYIVNLDIPKEKLLISSFISWHYVLSGMMFPKDEKNIDISSIWDNDKLEKQKIIDSWDNIFNVEDKDDILQACYNEIRPEFIKGIRKYIVNNK